MDGAIKEGKIPLTGEENRVVELIRAAFPFDDRAVPFDEGVVSLTGLEAADWPLLIKTANQHGLAPLAFAALKKCGRLDAIPQSARAMLWQTYLRASIANQLTFQELAFWLSYFESEGIPLIILKGGALAGTLYTDIALRPMGDLDFLIAPDAVERASRALIEQGYVAYNEVASGFANQFLVEKAFLRSGNRPSQIDIHWHLITTSYYAERIPIEWFWQRTMSISVNQRPALALSPTAQLLYLSAHYRLHHFRRLIWSYDLALLITRCFQQLDWDQAVASAAEFGLTQVVSEALSEVREHWRVAIPETVHQRLRARPAPWKERVIFAATDALPEGETELLHGFSLKGARRKSRYWWRLVFPSAAYMRKRYQIQSRSQVLLYYLRRVGKAAQRIARTGLFITRKMIFSGPAR